MKISIKQLNNKFTYSLFYLLFSDDVNNYYYDIFVYLCHLDFFINDNERKS